MEHKSDYLYLFSFTSRFWRDRSIQVYTHFIPQSKQRYIYTLPFAFDTFDIIKDISLFFSIQYPSCFSNVRHLSLSNLDEFSDLNMILKFFPKIQTITFSDKPTSGNTTEILNKHQWILQKYIFILNKTKFKVYFFIDLD
jgi:hypothetical protein